MLSPYSVPLSFCTLGTCCAISEFYPITPLLQHGIIFCSFYVFFGALYFIYSLATGVCPLPEYLLRLCLDLVLCFLYYIPDVCDWLGS